LEKVPKIGFSWDSTALPSHHPDFFNFQFIKFRTFHLTLKLKICLICFKNICEKIKHLKKSVPLHGITIHANSFENA